MEINQIINYISNFLSSIATAEIIAIISTIISIISSFYMLYRQMKISQYNESLDYVYFPLMNYINRQKVSNKNKKILSYLDKRLSDEKFKTLLDDPMVIYYFKDIKKKIKENDIEDIEKSYENLNKSINKSYLKVKKKAGYEKYNLWDPFKAMTVSMTILLILVFSINYGLLTEANLNLIYLSIALAYLFIIISYLLTFKVLIHFKAFFMIKFNIFINFLKNIISKILVIYSEKR